MLIDPLGGMYKVNSSATVAPHKYLLPTCNTSSSVCNSTVIQKSKNINRRATQYSVGLLFHIWCYSVYIRVTLRH